MRTNALLTNMEGIVAFSIIAISILGYYSVISDYSGQGYANMASSANVTLSYYLGQQISYGLYQDNYSYNSSVGGVKLINIIKISNFTKMCQTPPAGNMKLCNIVSHDGKIYLAISDADGKT